jgi:hypothetical protein
MGADAPKSAELLIEIEDQVKDAILEESCEDPVLGLTLSLIINSIQTERPLYQSPLEEPAFYQTYLRRWVEEGLEELRTIKRLTEKSGENE